MSKNKSKTKNIFKRIFPNHSNSSKKSKTSLDNCEIEIATKQCADEEEMADDIYNMNMLNLSTVPPDEVAFRFTDLSDSNHVIRTDASIIDNTPLIMVSDGEKNDDPLTLPMSNNVRKYSNCDSTVDLKFFDDTQGHGKRTHISVCTSSSLVLNKDCIIKSDENLRTETKQFEIKRKDSSSSWGKIKAVLVWIPFIQQYAKCQYPWIQIAGHQGNFKPGEQGTVLKKHCGRESICLQLMSECNLVDFIPHFKGDIFYENEKYICMQDLLAQFHKPSLMDIKMGTRTYLEEEISKAKSSPKPRQDMYEKMIAVDKDEPTAEEHRFGAVIKPRYMQWRESLSSTLLLGFRIEGIKKSVGTQSRNYKRTRDRHEVKDSLVDFIDKDKNLLRKFINRLQSLRKNLNDSNFFWNHEFIGSSLLFVHDKSGNANIWMIDFGKTIPLPSSFRVDHISPWIEGNHEDGYLFGLDNLLTLLQEIHSEISNHSR